VHCFHDYILGFVDEIFIRRQYRCENMQLVDELRKEFFEAVENIGMTAVLQKWLEN
jgi:hypothetical protein